MRQLFNRQAAPAQASAGPRAAAAPEAGPKAVGGPPAVVAATAPSPAVPPAPAPGPPAAPASSASPAAGKAPAPVPSASPQAPAKEEAAQKPGPGAAGPQSAPSSPDDAADGASRLAALGMQVAHTASRQKKPADSRALVAKTRQSAVAPGPEAKSKAAAATLAGLEQTGAETEPFDTAEFKKALREKLLSKMPDGKTGDDVEKALSHETGAEVANEMKGELAGVQAKAVGDLPAAAAKPQDPNQFSPPAPPKLAETPPGVRPAVPSAAGAVPAPLPDAALDTSADRNEADAQLASENLGQDQLKRSNEPSFVDAAETRDAAEAHSEAGPPQVRQSEDAALGAARGRGAGMLASGIGGLFGSRTAGFLRVFGQQDAAKAREEAKRAEIAERLDTIQRKTRSDVESRLDMMEKVALIRFNLGLSAALRAFDEQREKTEEAIRKTNRSDALASGNVIGAVWAGWGDLDEDEVEHTIRAARRAYNEAIDRAIDEVANFVGPVLDWVKKRIEQGRKEAADYVAGLGASVAEIAATELERINGEFDTLSGDVESRRDGLITKLGESYAASKKLVEERAQAFRDANKSWWQKLKEKVRGIINAIIEIKNMFATVLAKLAGVVGAILSDPIDFLGNLITGVKRGLDNFSNNFLTHLKAGFFEWLFGQTAKAGIEMPKTFDAAGIFGLIASILGLTVANIRSRAVTKVGAPVVEALETGAGILTVLKEQGIAGLWEMLKDKLESLKELVIEQVQSMLLTEVVKAGIMWIISLLNPAAAFIKACKAIYEIVMFFVNNGKRIMDFVNAVIDSIGAIAKGQLDAAAAKVEDSLARMIPLIIGFLAALLNLGGIADKVKKIIARLQAPVNKAIDWVIDKAVAGGKALFAAGKKAVKSGAKAVKGAFGWAKAKAGFKDREGHSHTVYVDASSGKPRLTVRSDPQTALAFVNNYAAHAKLAANDAKVAAATAAINAAQTKATQIDTSKNAGATEAQLAPHFQQLLDLNVAVSDAIRLLVIDKNVSALQNLEVYKLEGTTGTYASMPKLTGDKLTPDHQPQKALFILAKSIEDKAGSCFPVNGVFNNFATGEVGKGFAINLYNKRHYKGRTYGGKSVTTLTNATNLFNAPALRSMNTQLRLAEIIKIFRHEVKEDVEEMEKVYDPTKLENFDDIVPDPANPTTPQKDLVADICKRVKKGGDEMKNQDLDRLTK